MRFFLHNICHNGHKYDKEDPVSDPKTGDRYARDCQSFTVYGTAGLFLISEFFQRYDGQGHTDDKKHAEKGKDKARDAQNFGRIFRNLRRIGQHI